MDFGRMFSSWKSVLLSPKTALTVEAGRDNVSLLDGAIPFFIAAVILAIFTFIGYMIGGIFNAAGSSSATGAAMIFGVGLLGGAIFAIVTLALSFVLSFLGTFVIWIISLILGGRASFTKLYYVSSTFMVPLQIIAAVISIIPCVGSVVALAGWIYSLTLLAIALKRLYGFDNTKAGIVIAIPLAIIVLIAIIAAVILGAALMSMVSAFSSVKSV
ncbi:MAG TPA: Yip1 family protein [Candidatus Micrarchaeota archaeon]|nr:Yip1 family protein [Candidatus Micrarchaeota archaeon]